MILSKCHNAVAIFIGDGGCEECLNRGEWKCSECGNKCIAWDSTHTPEQLRNDG